MRDELGRLLASEPFKPFQIKLVNGDVHNVFEPQSVNVKKMTVTITWRYRRWVIFSVEKIASLESLLVDLQRQAGKHARE